MHIQNNTGQMYMKSETIGTVRLYISKQADCAPQTLGEDDRQLQQIVQNYREDEYHSQITLCKNWTVMYQLAESRANIIEWLEIPRYAKVLEIGAGCGTITSALRKKGAGLTCQDENLHYCRLNAIRQNRSSAREAGSRELTIYAGPFEECEAQFADDYDVIVCMDALLTEEKAQTLLASLRRHLKPEGMLVLAAKNKFGLKYWAGNREPHTDQYFAGLENAGVRLYSGKRLQQLLEQTGFDSQECYYPYPDERFALEIYSDRHLPKKGDLNYNIVNYEGDRFLLFDEQKVFDSIIEEGQFPFFANAYLFLAGAKGRAQLKQETVYVRYATDRGREHAVCTQITEHAVYKRPMYAEGTAHIRHLYEAYEKLEKQYGQTKLKFNRCAWAAGLSGQNRLPLDAAGKDESDSREEHECLRFELLYAHTLQEQVEQAVAQGELKKVFDILHRMMQYIRNGSGQTPFQMTEGFQKVFGSIPDVQALEGTACSDPADIDLILPNIFIGEDGTWQVIDYEWTFFFPVPRNFIIYRTLFFLNHENPRLEALSMEHLLKLAEIAPKEAAVYAQMEQAFQQYVAGGLIPYREMVNLLGRRFIDIVQLQQDYDRIAAQNELLKGQGIWKAARKIKRKLTGN